MSERVNAAVKIKIALGRKLKPETRDRLSKDLRRLTDGMNTEEYSDYWKRIA